ncbi:MAG: ribonuclease HII [Candidatus Dormibacteraceae bacterium]
MAAPRGRSVRPRRVGRWVSEIAAREMGYGAIAGIDEVGMGPLAGPAVAAAVVLPVGARLPGLNDSKRLSPDQRAAVESRIRKLARAIGICSVEAGDIDRHGLTWARQRAMQGAVEALSVEADYLLIDAFDIPDLAIPQLAVIKGDTICASIMAASVIAKVFRDQLMTDYDEVYPGYGFSLHKGYGTARHLSALLDLGPCPIHRLSWGPLRGLQGGTAGDAEIPDLEPSDRRL